MLPTFVALCLAADPAVFTVTGKAEVSHPWCGGAMPSPSQRERRLPEQEPFVLKAGDRNTEVTPVATVTPKADGSFSVKLPAGKWCVVEKARSDVPPSKAAMKPQPAGTPRAAMVGTPDYACLDSVWGECLEVFEVNASVKDVQVTRYVPCSFQVRCPAKGELPPPPPPSSVR